MALSVLLLALYSWKIGLGLLLLSCCTFISLETASAPPANRPDVFTTWQRLQRQRCPVLLCLGDSLLHGTISSSVTPEIPTKVCQALGMELPLDRIFADPIWVVNAAQNNITSHTVVNERLNKAMGCYPDYILIMIGTNDLLSVYNPSTFGKSLIKMNELPEAPSLQVFERNLTRTINFIRQSSPLVQIGVCTLPPLGENLNSRSNDLVRQANQIIESVVAKEANERCSVVPVHSKFEAVLEKEGRKKFSLPLDISVFVSGLQVAAYHLLAPCGCFTWNMLGKLVGNSLLFDGIHLNDKGRDLVVEAIVDDWLVKKNIAKAIAVKTSS